MKNYIEYHLEYIFKNYWITIELGKDLNDFSDDELLNIKKYIQWFYDWILALRLKIKNTIND